MNLTITVNDENLTKAINEGITELPKESISKIAEAAFIEYFKSNASNLFGEILFEKTSGYGYNNKKNPSKLFKEIIQEFIKDEDVKPIKDAIIKYILENNAELVHQILLEAIINLIGAYDFKTAVSRALIQIGNNTDIIANYLRVRTNDSNGELENMTDRIDYIPDNIINSQEIDKGREDLKKENK